MTQNVEINHKQAEILDRLFQEVQRRFPTIVRQELRRSPEDKEHLWLYVEGSMTEEEEVDFINFSGDLEADILLDTGYSISLMPRFTAPV
jgi:hypothetical protein